MRLSAIGIDGKGTRGLIPAAVPKGAAVFSFALSHLILTFDAGNEATVLHI